MDDAPACPDSQIVGVDEAGRGPLAGPVCAAAVILDPDRPIAGLADSKQLTAPARERLAVAIQSLALDWSLAWASVEEIERLNILHASLLAMRRAVLGLRRPVGRVLIDGNRCPDLPYPALAIVGGDRREPAISAASILAKVARDRLLCELDTAYPHYGFARHKGYPTRQHLDALRRLGPCPQHRRSFGPVRDCMVGKDAADTTVDTDEVGARPR